jgi:hypothetical protein
MSHFAVTVIIDESADISTMNACLEEALEQYNENGECFREGSRWDWWVVGGRWEGELVTLNGKDCDIARKKDIDWDAMGAKQIALLEEEYERVIALVANPWLEPALDGESKEAYVRRLFKPFYTYAFLDADGVWHEKGRMGWFGQSMENEDGEGEKDDWPSQYQALLRAVKDRDCLVIVDCHV